MIKIGVGDMAKISYHDSLSCWFYYFASCLSVTAKLISLSSFSFQDHSPVQVEVTSNVALLRD